MHLHCYEDPNLLYLYYNLYKITLDILCLPLYMHLVFIQDFYPGI